MNRRKILSAVTILLALGGLIFAVIPFVSSMTPSEAAKNSARVLVKISDVPDEGALVVDYRSNKSFVYFNKAFVVRNPELRVFRMTHWNEKYRLPDLTWERAFTPCGNFLISSVGFSCEDPSLDESWNREATWDLTGKSKGTWMPDLELANFQIEGEYIVLSPEYD